MNVFTIVLDGILRRKIRTILSVLGIAIAATALFTLISLKQGYESAIKSELANMGAHIVAVAKGCPYEAVAIIMMGGQVPATLPEAVIEDMDKIEGIAVASPNVVGVFEHKGENHPVVGVNVAEIKLKPWWVIDGNFPGEYGEILLGSAEASMFAENNNFYGVGDIITVIAAGKEVEFKVVGILDETGSKDDYTSFTTLETAQKLFNMEGRVVSVNIKLKDIAEIPDVMERIESIPDVQGVTIAQVVGTVQSLAGTGETMLMYVLILALVIGGLGTMNTMLMTVFERTREIALMKTIGASERQVFTMFVVEGLVICLAGSLLGIAVGSGTVLAGDLILKQLVPVMPVESVGQLSWQAFSISISLPVLIGVFSSLYPAYRAARLKPVEALKNE